MPEDKDFKRLVRERMAESGELYTEARGHLRPPGDEAVAPPTADPNPYPFPYSVRPLDLDEVLTRRRSRAFSGTDSASERTGPL